MGETEKPKKKLFIRSSNDILYVKYDYVSSAGKGDLAPDYVDYGHMEIAPDHPLNDEGYPRWDQAKAEELYSLIVLHTNGMS